MPSGMSGWPPATRRRALPSKPSSPSLNGSSKSSSLPHKKPKSMVSIAAAQSDTQGQLSSGLTAEDSARVMEAHAFVKPIYSGKPVGTGQDAFEFSERVATVLALLNTDADTRIA